MRDEENSKPVGLSDIISNSGGWDQIEVRDYEYNDFESHYKPEGSSPVTLEDLEAEAAEQRYRY